MFYSQIILARKGPLGKIWLAAHFDKKLTKNQIFSTDISSSVESVLNPAAPLALRVSGHLMLGICRIYSRKVKYLMSDCTEAMWKIKLAFRPGNVDIDLNNATANIDDARFYGNYEMDNEFSTLENAAFPQMLLNAYDIPAVDADQRQLQQQQQPKRKSEKLSTSSSQRDSLDVSNYDISFGFRSDAASQPSPSQSRASALDRNVLSSSRLPTPASKLSGRVSDIEIMRGAQHQSISSMAKASLSVSIDERLKDKTSSRRDSSLSISMNFEDDIPAFEDVEAGRSRHYNSMGGMDMQELLIEDLVEYGDTGKGGADFHPPEQEPENMPFVPEPVFVEQEITSKLKVADETAMEEEAQGMSPSAPTQRRRNTKRQNVVIDERVELTGRQIKQRMADLGPILRRKVGDPLPDLEFSSYNIIYDHPITSNSISERAALPTNLRDLCPELLATFRMMMSADPLPLRSIETVDAAEEVNLGAQAKRESMSIEVTRGMAAPAPRDTRLSVAGSSVAEGGRAGDTDVDYSLGHIGDESISGTILSPTDRTVLTARKYEEPSNLWDQDLPQEAPQAEMPFEMEDVAPPTFEPAEEFKAADISSIKAKVVATPDLRISTVKNALSERLNEVLDSTMEATHLEQPGADDSSSGDAEKKVDDVARGRSRQVLQVIQDQIKKQQGRGRSAGASGGSVKFSELTAGVNRRSAAVCFLEILQLKTWGELDLQQEQPYDEIEISALRAGGAAKRAAAVS